MSRSSSPSITAMSAATETQDRPDPILRHDQASMWIPFVWRSPSASKMAASPEPRRDIRAPRNRAAPAAGLGRAYSRRILSVETPSGGWHGSRLHAEDRPHLASGVGAPSAAASARIGGTTAHRAIDVAGEPDPSGTEGASLPANLSGHNTAMTRPL